MDSQSRQEALNNISEEDLAKIKAHQAKTQGGLKVDNEWMLLAEFAAAYGWQAYQDAIEDRIDAAEMMTLIEAHRKLEAKRMYENAQAAFIGAISAKTKKPSQTFNTLTRNLLKIMKVDE